MAGLRAEIDLVVSQRSKDKAAAEVQRIMEPLSKRGVSFNINERSFTQPLGRITGAANEFTKSLEASNARVIAFGASVGIINGISDAFKNLVAETVRFEKTLADVNVILNASNAAIESFGSGLFDVAKNTAQGFNVAAEAALEFSRQGLSMNEVLKRTTDALTLTRLTSLKAEEAVKGLTAAVNSYGDAALTTTAIIDKLAAVDVKFAVSSEDLIHGLQRTGAVAIDAGVEIDSLIGLITALQQTTARGGAVIGNGLKTIFTRIQRPESLRQLEELDIQVKNLAGSVLPADTILLNMAKTFDKLTQSQQSNLVQFSAGIFQANIFRGILRDLSKTQSIHSKALDVSAGAAGEAAQKNEQLNKTIAALASQSAVAVQELAGVMGDLMLKPEMGEWLNVFKGAIDGMKNLLGGGEEEGSTFAKGLVRGIGNILTGPAAIAFGVVFIKLFVNIAKFAKNSLKDVIGIVGRKEKILQMETAILEVLSRNRDLTQSLNNLEGDRGAQESFILKIIEMQTNAMREQQRLAGRLAPSLISAGVSSDFSVKGTGPVDLDGDGRTDVMPTTASGIIPSMARKERKEASRGGYSAGAVDTMSIRGVGPVVYNKAEKVKQFPGMKQPAIMPPQRSRAGVQYRDAFVGKHGFDPYASHGFVPNFQLQNKPDMVVHTTPESAAFPAYIVKQLEGGSGSISFEINTSRLRGNVKQGGMGKIGQYLQDLGVQKFTTTIPVEAIDYPRTPTGQIIGGEVLRTGSNAQKGAFAEGVFGGSERGRGLLSTGADEKAVVDFIGKGQTPHEVKSGEVDLYNIAQKSIRRYSNKAFRNSLHKIAYERKDINPKAAKGLYDSMKLLEEETVIRNLQTLAHMGLWAPPGVSPEQARDLQSRGGGAFRKKMLDVGIGDADRELLESYGLSGGFVPNYRRLKKSAAQIERYQELARWVEAALKYVEGGDSEERYPLGELVDKERFDKPPSLRNAGAILRNLPTSTTKHGKANTTTLENISAQIDEDKGEGFPYKNSADFKGAVEKLNAYRKRRTDKDNKAVQAGIDYQDWLNSEFGGAITKGRSPPFDFPEGFRRNYDTRIGPGEDKLFGDTPGSIIDAHAGLGHEANHTGHLAKKAFRYISKAPIEGIDKDEDLATAISSTPSKGYVNLNSLLDRRVTEVLGGDARNEGTAKSSSFPFTAIGGSTLKDIGELSKIAALKDTTKGATLEYYQDVFLQAAGGLIPNFTKGLYDSDYLAKGPGSIQERNAILDGILGSGLAYDVFHGVPGAGKSTAARNKFPGAELISGLQHFRDTNWTDFAVVSGTRRSRSKIKAGAPPTLDQYSDQAQRILRGARKVFGLTPSQETLKNRRQARINQAQSGKLPDSRDAKALEGAAIGGRGDIVVPDTDLYDQLEAMGIPVERILGRGLIPNFARDNKGDMLKTLKVRDTYDATRQQIDDINEFFDRAAKDTYKKMESAMRKQDPKTSKLLSKDKYRKGLHAKHSSLEAYLRQKVGLKIRDQLVPELSGPHLHDLKYSQAPTDSRVITNRDGWTPELLKDIEKSYEVIYRDTINQTGRSWNDIGDQKYKVLSDVNIMRNKLGEFIMDDAAGGFVPNFGIMPAKGDTLLDDYGIFGERYGNYKMLKVSRGTPDWNRDISVSGGNSIKIGQLHHGRMEDYGPKSRKQGRSYEWLASSPRRHELDAISKKAKERGRLHKKAAIRTHGSWIDVMEVDNHQRGTSLQLHEDGKTWLYWYDRKDKEHQRLIEQLMAEGVPMREVPKKLGGYDYGTQVEDTPSSVVQGFRQGYEPGRARGFIPNLVDIYKGFNTRGEEDPFNSFMRGRPIKMAEYMKESARHPADRGKRKGSTSFLKYNVPSRVWSMLTASSMEEIERMGMKPNWESEENPSGSIGQWAVDDYYTPQPPYMRLKHAEPELDIFENTLPGKALPSVGLGKGDGKKFNLDTSFLRSRGHIPNFAQIYRGQHHLDWVDPGIDQGHLQKNIGPNLLRGEDTPQIPDFLLRSPLAAASNEKEFVDAIKFFLQRHTSGRLSGSFAEGAYRDESGMLQTQRPQDREGSWRTKRGDKGKWQAMGSGAVSYTTDESKAEAFAKGSFKAGQIDLRDPALFRPIAKISPEDEVDQELFAQSPGAVWERELPSAAIWTPDSLNRYFSSGDPTILSLRRGMGMGPKLNKKPYTDTAQDPLRWLQSIIKNKQINGVYADTLAFGVGLPREKEITRLFGGGFIPNFQGQPTKPRSLDLSWLNPDAGKGPMELRKIFQDIVGAAESGDPYTKIRAGGVVGPRIPRLLVEGHNLLNKLRSSGKNIPKIHLDGTVTPAKLMQVIHQNKERSTGVFASKQDYKAGEEREVMKYLRIMGLDPMSSTSVDLSEIPMFSKGVAGGLIPNFALSYAKRQKIRAKIGDTGATEAEQSAAKRMLAKDAAQDMGTRHPWSQGMPPDLSAYTGPPEEVSPALLGAHAEIGPKFWEFFKPGNMMFDLRDDSKLQTVHKRIGGMDARMMEMRDLKKFLMGDESVLPWLMSPPLEWTSGKLDLLKKEWKQSLSRLTNEIPYISKKLDIDRPFPVAKGLVPNFAEGVKLWDQPGEMSPFNKKHRAGEKLDQLVRMIDKWVKYAETTDDVAKINERLKKAQEYMDMADDLIASGDLRGSGFVPNFANPLREAISREIGAGVPKSRIRVEQSGQLKSAVNPMGLAVTNTRDEPAGINQGIRRARSQGIDPRIHGAGRGFIPGFAEGDAAKDLKELAGVLEQITKSKIFHKMGDDTKDMAENLAQALALISEPSVDPDEKKKALKGARPKIEKLASEMDKKLKAKLPADEIHPGEGAIKEFEGLKDKLTAFGEAVEGATEEAKESDNAFGGSLQNLFFFQSLISGANGFLQEFSESTNQATRMMGQLGLSVSDVVAAHVQQKQIIGEIMNADWAKRDGPDDKPAVSLFGDNSTASVFSGEGWAKGGKPGGGKQLFGGLGKSIGPLITKAKLLAKGLTRFLPLVGQLYTAFTAVNKAFTFFTKDNESLTDMMSSGVTRATKRIEELGKASEEVSGIMTDLKKSTENQETIAQLEKKGATKTLKEEKELSDLRISQMKLEAKSMAHMNKLASMAGSKKTAESLAGDMFVDLTSKGMEAAKALEKVEGALAGAELALSTVKGFQEGINQLATGWEVHTLGMADREFSDLSGAGKKAVLGPMQGGIRGMLTQLGPDLAAQLAKSTKELKLSGGDFADEDRWMGAIDKGLAGAGPEAQGIVAGLKFFATLLDEEEDAMGEIIDALQQEAVQAKKTAQIAKARKHSFLESDRLMRKINSDLKIEAKLKTNQFAIEKKQLELQFLIKDNLNKSLESMKARSAGLAIDVKLGNDINKLREDNIIKEKEINEKFNQERIKQLKEIIKGGLDTSTIEEDFFKPDELKGAENFAKEMERLAATARGPVQKTLLGLAQNIKDQTGSFNVATGVGGVLDYGNIEAGILKEFAAMKGTAAEANMLAVLQVLENRGLLKLTKDVRQALEENGRLKRVEIEHNKDLEDAQVRQLRIMADEEDFNKRTVRGAAIRAQRLEEDGSLVEQMINTRAGELANLEVENNFSAQAVDILKQSNTVKSTGLQNAIKNTREENIKGIEQNAVAAAQLALLKTNLEIGNNAKEIFANKLISENLAAKQSAEETRLRADYLANFKTAVNDAQTRLVQAKDQHKIDFQTKKADLFLLSIDHDLGIQKKQELQMELMAAHTTIINNNEKEKQLKVNQKLTKALQDAVYIQEQQNAVTEARNAIEMAALDQRKFETKQGLKFITEKAGAITQTREAAGRFQATGRTEDLKAYHDQLTKTNQLFGQGARAMDALRSKLIDLDLAAENFGADLVNIGIDNARSGLVQMFKDIGTGAKTASKAWGDFGLGLANVLADRWMQHNVDQIIKNFTFAFTGESTETIQKQMNANLGKLSGKLPELQSALARYAAAVERSADAIREEIRRKGGRDLADAKTDPVTPFQSMVKALTDQITIDAGLIKNANVTYMDSILDGAHNVGIAIANLKNNINEAWKKSETFAIQAGWRRDPDYPTGTRDAVGIDRSLSEGDRLRRRAIPVIAARLDPDLPISVRERVRNKDKSTGDKVAHLPWDKGIRKGTISPADRKEIEDVVKSLMILESQNPESATTANRRFLEGKSRVHTGTTYSQVRKMVFNKEGNEMELSAQGQAGSAGGGDVLAKAQKEGLSVFQIDDILNEEITVRKEALQDLRKTAENQLDDLEKRAEIDREIIDKNQKQLDEERSSYDKTWNKIKAERDQADPATEKGTRTIDAANLELAKLADEKLPKLEAKAKALDLARLNLEKTEAVIKTIDKSLTDGVIKKAEIAQNNIIEFMEKLVNLSHQISKEKEIGKPVYPTTGAHLASGGRIQRFAKGGFVQGPPGKDNIPALLTAGEFVVPKEMAKGGEASAGDRVKSGALASAQALTMTLVAQEIGDAINKKDADKPPTFNMNKLNTLDLGSDVNLKRGDRRLSAKFLARDPVMQDYKDYLLDLAAFNVQQKNAKQREKMQTLGTIYGAVTSFAVAQASSLLAKPINHLVTKGQNFLGSNFGKHSAAYDSLKAEVPDANYADVKAAMKDGVAPTYDGVKYIPEPGPNGKVTWHKETTKPASSVWNKGDALRRQVAFLRGIPSPRERATFPGSERAIGGRQSYYTGLSDRDTGGDVIQWARGGAIPAMLTAGEGYIPAPIAQRIGYNNLDQMNRTGSMPIIEGPGGIDNVGPVGLSEGDFIIKKSSTDKLLRENPNMMRFALQNPDGFKRGKTGYYEGGVVDAGLTMPASSLQPSSGPDGSSVSRMGLLESTETTNTASTSPSQSSETTNNININVSIDQSGAEATSETSEGTSYEQEKDLSLKIKGAVLDVIRQEKRIGGELS